MLTESEARDLLALAGATIEVSPVTTLPDVPPRKRWPVLAAAAAVLAVVGVGAALGLRSGDDAPVGVETVPRVDFQGRPDVLGEGQLPSVFGYSGAAALDMLADLGLDVTLGNWVVPCGEPDGRAVRTEPAVGTRFEPGDSVVLLTGVSANEPCPIDADKEFAWQLVDFANGRGRAPAFADEVWVGANEESAVIPGSTAADPATWVDGSPLGVLRQQSREVGQYTGYTFQTPILVTLPSDLSPHCSGIDLSGVPHSGPGLSISIEFLADGISRGCTVVDVFRTNGRISAISLRTNQVPPDPALVTVPDVVGLSIEDARAALDSAGLLPGEHAAVRFPGHFCTQGYQVISQTPDPGTPLVTSGVVLLETSWVDCSGRPAPVRHDPESLARAFAEFASSPTDSGHGLLIENAVRLYLANNYVRTLPGPDAHDPGAWAVCRPGSGSECSTSATQALGSGMAGMGWSTTPSDSPCVAALGDPPDNTGGALEVAISPAHPSTCRDFFEVQLFTDGGQVVAVNLLLGSP